MVRRLHAVLLRVLTDDIGDCERRVWQTDAFNLAVSTRTRDAPDRKSANLRLDDPALTVRTPWETGMPLPYRAAPSQITLLALSLFFCENRIYSTGGENTTRSLVNRD